MFLMNVSPQFSVKKTPPSKNPQGAPQNFPIPPKQTLITSSDSTLQKKTDRIKLQFFLSYFTRVQYCLQYLNSGNKYDYWIVFACLHEQGGFRLIVSFSAKRAIMQLKDQIVQMRFQFNFYHHSTAHHRNRIYFRVQNYKTKEAQWT